MKRSLPYEIAAAITAVMGAFLLVFLYYPVINPGQYILDTGNKGEPFGYYLILTPIPLMILVAAWRLNRKAQSLKIEERNADDGKGRKP